MSTVTLYSPNATFPESLLHKTEPPIGIRIHRDTPIASTQYVLNHGIYTVTLNQMKSAEIPEHLAGFVKYISLIYGGKPDERGTQIIKQIRRSRMVIGVTIEPATAPPEPALQLVNTVAAMSQSLVFINGVLLDFNDNLILAPDRTFHRRAQIDLTLPPKRWWQIW